MNDSVFRDPDAVEREMNLPAVVPYSFIGEASPDYEASVVSIIETVVGEDKIRKRSTQPSGSGKYVAYRFEVFHERFEDVEDIYARVAKLPGTKFAV